MISNKTNKINFALTAILLLIFVFALLSYIRRNNIVKENKPITCYVIDIHCKHHSRDASHCVVIFNQKQYNVGITSVECKSLQVGENENIFYYDFFLDIIFTNKLLNSRIILVLFLLLLIMIALTIGTWKNAMKFKKP